MSELTEPIETINKRLVEYFGKDTLSGAAIWRVAFSDDLKEKRLGIYDDYTEGGLYIRTVEEVREVPKYSWVEGKYILERLVIVPEFQQAEINAKLSYEPLWVFQDKAGFPLPPKWEAINLIVQTVYAAQNGGSHGVRKLVDKEATSELALAEKVKRVNKIQEELYGDQSSLKGTTVTGESIIVPNSYEKGN